MAKNQQTSATIAMPPQSTQNWYFCASATSAFVRPCESFKRNIGLLIFEFSKFYPSDYQHGRDFVADLDTFLGKLPSGWRYGVEIRNKHFLHPDYFSALSRRGVAHIYNSWADMPTPESCTVSSAKGLSDGSSTDTSIVPPRGVNLIAFITI